MIYRRRFRLLPLLGFGLILNLAAAEIEAHADPLIAGRPDLVDAFLAQPVEPAGGYLFSGDTFPVVRWQSPHLVQALWGEPPPELKVRWFDGAGDAVTEPGGAGRFAASPRWPRPASAMAAAFAAA